MGGYGGAAQVKILSGITYTDLGLTGDTALDEYIDDLNAQASEIVDDYCGRDFGLHGTPEAPVRVRLDGTGRNTIGLPGYPVISVVSVTLDGTPLTEGKEFDVISTSGILERIDHGIWRRGNRNITVEYIYGYTTPPNAVKRIVEGMVSAALRETKRYREVGGVSSISMDGYSVSYDRIAGNLDLTEDWMRILDRYRVVGAG